MSKLYHLGAVHQRPDTTSTVLSASLRDALTGVFRRGKNGSQAGDDTDLWALRDVSFEVKRGEVVGTPALASGASVPSTQLCAAPRRGRTGIGRNGAGKSTLVSTRLNTRLKTPSRITEPTCRRAETCGGRVSTLLAVGDAAFQKKPWSRYNMACAPGEVRDTFNELRE